jgi:hypothetical protein
MIITIKEAHQLANEKLGLKTRLIFHENVKTNDRFLSAIVNGMPDGAAALTLMQLGMANAYSEATEMLLDIRERCGKKTVDKKQKQ